MGSRSRLSAKEVQAFAAAHSGWRMEDGELRRTYEFNTFAESIAFVNRIAEVAERDNHHPDLDIRFRRVTVSLLTYDADGVTPMDTELALKIDAIRAALPPR